MSRFKVTIKPAEVLVTAGQTATAAIAVEGTNNYLVRVSDNPTWVVALHNVINIAPPEDHDNGTYNVTVTVTNLYTNAMERVAMTVNVIAREE